MLKVILWIVAMITFPILYILFSDIKPYNWRELGKYYPLSQTSLRDDYPSEEVVFQTLKDAGIKPCFLDVDSEEEERYESAKHPIK